MADSDGTDRTAATHRPDGSDQLPSQTEADTRSEAERMIRGPEQPAVEERGGPKGPEPTRYGDWEKGGRCSDF